MDQGRIGRYQILEEIAYGGQATVYRVRDTHTGQVVALKVMHPHLARDAAYLERFHREARLAASIRHPNVIRIFEVGQEGDSHFICMEHLPLSVHDFIEARGQLTIGRAVDICYQTALALQSAHQREIVHREHQASEHAARLGWHGEGDRLRHRPILRALHDDGLWSPHGHPSIYVT